MRCEDCEARTTRSVCQMCTTARYFRDHPIVVEPVPYNEIEVTTNGDS